MSHYFLAFEGFIVRDYKRALRTMKRCNEPLYVALYADGTYKTFIMSDVTSNTFFHSDYDLVIPIYTDRKKFHSEFWNVFNEWKRVANSNLKPKWLVEYQNNECDWWFGFPRIGTSTHEYSYDNGKSAQGTYAFNSFTRAMNYVYTNVN